MPVTPTYPGVYIEEIPSGVRTIVGVATSVTAFIDFFKRGPMNRAIQIFNPGDFEREFGGLHTHSEASYAIQQFFLNGGAEAWVVRVGKANTFKAASVTLQDTPAGNDVLTVIAGRRIQREPVEDPGAWGNRLRLDVDYDTTDPENLFNLTVTEIESQNGREVVVRSETFRNLTMKTGEKNNTIEVVNEASRLVQLSRESPWPLKRPAQTGTGGNLLGGLPTTLSNGDKFSIQYGSTTKTATLSFTSLTDLSQLRTVLQAAIRGAASDDPLLSGATVQLIGNKVDGYRFRVLAGRGGSGFNPQTILTFTEVGGGTTAAALGLTGAGVAPNVQQYALGTGTGVVGAQKGGAEGKDGDPPDADALRGKELDKSGLYALEEVDIFNILCIPRVADLDDMSTVLSEAEAYCLQRRAFLLVDVPSKIDTVQEVKDWLEQNATLRHRNAAVYFPRPRIPDPLNNYRLRSVGASGTIAGLYARTDAERGVWKAPAGTEAVLRNVKQLDYKLTDPENGTLNPLGINCLRTFNIYGNICWGARTLDGSDQQASEWKYVPVRRLALFLEESLYRGTQWVVFEPNDEPLWAQIRLNVGAFMHNLFRQGAFQGKTPREAYFVKCDKETTTQNDINLGIVNILVGFAPLKPAEFVIIKIQQIAGEVVT